MPLLKSARGLPLNKSHPFLRGLIGCWAFNEGTGKIAADTSGNQNSGTINDAVWTAGKFGCCLKFDGSGDSVNCGSGSSLNAATGLTIAGWIRFEASKSHTLLMKNVAYGVRISTTSIGTRLWDSGGGHTFNASFTYLTGKWYYLAVTWDSKSQNVITYINANPVGTPGTFVGPLNASTQYILIGKVVWSDSYTTEGLIDSVQVYNRALSSAEIKHLYREPFCMFDGPKSSKTVFVPVVNLAGTSGAQSSATATAKLTRRIKGLSAAATDVTATMKIVGEALLAGSIEASAVPSGKLTLRYRGPWLKSPLKIERQWLTDVLFNGMTASAFKLGTVLASGWFWMRPSGCTALYGGPNMEQIDFANILEVVEQDADSISLPNYIPHKIDSTYFYVVRKFNICGYQERSLQAAAKLAIDAEGNLIEPKPNHIFAWRADQIQGNKVQLLWFYYPLEQKSEPVRFNVYYDSNTGQINYKNPIAEISYRGRRFYRWQSDALTTGRYLFAVRAKDADGVESNSLAQLAIEIEDVRPDEIEILKVEAL